MKTKMIAAAALAMASATPASATVFAWSFVSTDGTVNSSGTFTATDNLTTIYGRAAYVVALIDGTRNGVAITGLVRDFPSAYGGADNYLYPTGDHFTYSGVSYGLADGSFVNLFNNYEYFATNLAGTMGDVITPGTFTFGGAAAVPEPATWAMLLCGFAMVGAATRYRRRGNNSVYA